MRDLLADISIADISIEGIARIPATNYKHRYWPRKNLRPDCRRFHARAPDTIAGLADRSKIEVIATASDPFIAAERISEVPGVITLDIEMPRMDGFTFLREIVHAH